MCWTAFLWLLNFLAIIRYVAYRHRYLHLR